MKKKSQKVKAKAKRHAERMVLIPESEYKMLKGGKTNEFKDRMEKIFRKPRNYKAAKEMSQLIGQAIRYQKPAKKSKPNILPHFSPLYHRKIHFLLNNSTLDYNDKLEMVIQQAPVPQSNIVDVLREAFVGSRKKERKSTPKGWEEFINMIANSDIPLSTFTKSTTKQDIQEARGGRGGGGGHGQPIWEMF